MGCTWHLGWYATDSNTCGFLLVCMCAGLVDVTRLQPNENAKQTDIYAHSGKQLHIGKSRPYIHLGSDKDSA